MKINAKWKGDIIFESVGENTGQSVNMDAGKQVEGGQGSAPSPMEMLLHGVAGCMGIDMNVIMRHSMDQVDSIDIEVDAEQNDMPPKYFTDIVIKVDVTGTVKPKVVKRAVELSHDKYCSAINSLKADSRIEVTLNGDRI